MRTLVSVIGFTLAGAGLAAGAVGLTRGSAQEKGPAAQVGAQAAKGPGRAAKAAAVDDLSGALAKPLTTAERQQLIAEQDNLQLDIELLELEVSGIRDRLLQELAIQRSSAQRARQQFQADPEGMARQFQLASGGQPRTEVSKEEIEEYGNRLDSALKLAMTEMKEVQLEYRAASERLRKMKAQAALLAEKLQAPDAEPRRIKPGDTLIIEILEATPGRPVTGERRVRSDGTVHLGWYGVLPVAGLNHKQAKVALIRHMQHYLTDESLGLTGPDENGKQIDVPPVDSDRVFLDDSRADAEASRGAGDQRASSPRVRDSARARQKPGERGASAP